MNIEFRHNMDANQTTPAYELKDELARLCLPSAGRDANLKLAWVNSVCLLFLLIGSVGARRGLIAIKPAPPIEEIVPVILAAGDVAAAGNIEKQENPDENKNDVPRVAVVIPTTRRISVSACRPSARWWFRPISPARRRWSRCGRRPPINLLNSTGAGGERPEPPYPKIALEEGEQGSSATRARR